MSGRYELYSFMLTVLDTLPERFLDTPARELHRLLAGPTLIHLPGRRQPPLFISVLLHGNEDSGVVALQSVLRAYGQRLLPRALSILIGHVAAAREGLRRLDHQPDDNRVWPGGKAHTGQEFSHTAPVEQGVEQVDRFVERVFQKADGRE